MADNSTEPKGRSRTARIHFIPAGIVAAGIIACLIAVQIAGDYKWKFFGILLVVALAAAFFGVFMGLIFGVPKLNDKYNPSSDYNENHKYMPNTNLEEMSDWLTKIIVGVSLTQLAMLPGYFSDLADYILADNACAFSCDYSKGVVVSVIIYFLISGFLTGYLYTRLYLPRLFTVMEDKEKMTEEKNRKEVEAKIWEASYRDQTNLADGGDGHRAARKQALDSFTRYEKHMLKIIADADNRFVAKRLLKFDDYAAVNVLLRKGIIKIAEGGDFRLGATLSIVDDALLKTIKEQENSGATSDPEQTPPAKDDSAGQQPGTSE